MILLKVINPKGEEIFHNQTKSDANGQFYSKYNFRKNKVTKRGTFTISAESQCREEHRNICDNNSSPKTLVILNYH